MKIEKAKQHLSRWAMNPNSPLAQDQNYVWRDVSVIEAIEIAEQEAEERMRKKAAKAYCQDCCCTIVGECRCGIGSENCEALRDFIQKLNENGND